MIRDGPKQTIFASGGFGLLQTESELDMERCANKDVGLSRGVDCEVPHWLRRGMKDVETSL